MKIESKSITITDVPGVNWIKVEHGETVPLIGVDWSDGSTAGVFSPAKLKELIDALTAAHSMAMGKPVTPDGLYATWQDIPDSVTSVRDKDGEWWVRGNFETWGQRMGIESADPNQYAPFGKAG